MVARRIRLLGLGAGVVVVIGITSASLQSVSLPPPEDESEEILRTEIITEARSPIDGKSLTAAEYAELQSRLQESSATPPLSPKLRENIFLLRIRRLFRTVAPFLPL